jgi:hypothetical protein
MQVETASVWRVLSASTRGSAHLRLGLPNQDAFASWAVGGDSGRSAILCVSDGHGAARHFRSEAGARIAVETTTNLLRRELIQSGSSSLRVPSEAMLSAVLYEIVTKWREEVAAHAARHPFTSEEWASLVSEGDGDEARRHIETDVAVAYGATLIAVIASADAVVCLQLGDGDILFVDEEGRTSRPLPPDPRLVANQTTSLCMPEAWQEFRVHVQTALPALILVSSDGYANSFRSESDFLQIGPDYLQLVRDRGAALATDLSDILSEASSRGSGDDITLGMLIREGATAGAARQPGTLEDGSLAGRVAMLEESLANLRHQHQAELRRAEERLNTVKRRGDRATMMMILALAAAVAFGIPVIKGLYVTRVKAASGAAGPVPAAREKPSVPDAVGRELILNVNSPAGARSLTLQEGTQFTAEQVGVDPKQFGDGPIGKVALTKNGELELLNSSKTTWKYTTAVSSADKQLPPKGSIKLQARLVLKWGDVTATIE